MAKIIEAKAVITATDKTGPAFDAIAKKLKKMGASSKEVDKISAAVKRAREQMAAVDRFAASRGGFEAARRNFNEAKIAVEGAARAMASARAPTREMEANYRRARQAVASASRAFEAQKTAVLSNKRALESMGIPINKAASHQARLRAEVERTTAALRRQEGIAERRHNRRTALAGAAAYGGHQTSYAARRAARATFHTYREYDKERRFAKVVMGLSDEEQKPLIDQANKLGYETRYSGVQVLEAQRELAARGLDREQVIGVIAPAANLGQSLDLPLPNAVQQIEGSLFGFKRDISTRDKAVAAAKRTSDMQVAAAKASGMTPEDLVQVYKYGATPARLSGIDESTLLAFAGISKKANLGGDESGVAFRAMMASLTRPTRVAREAMLANGLNFKNYQKMPDRIATRPFVENIAAQYGVRLDKKTQLGLQKIFGNKDLISDPAKFAPAVSGFLKQSLGGRDAKSLKSIAGAANRYRDASVQQIDMNALIADLFEKLPGNKLLADSIFGSRQGGRIATAIGDPQTFMKMLKAIKESEDRAAQISEERMAGFDGAVYRFIGAVTNLESAIGRGLDDDGKGGFLTAATDWMATATQWLADQNPKVVAGGAVAAGAAGLGLAGYTAYKFLHLLTTGGGLTASAVALDGSAAALTAAAVKLGGGSVAGDIAGGGSKVAKGKGLAPKILGAGMVAGGAVGGGAAILYTGYQAITNFPTISHESEKEKLRKTGAEEYQRRRSLVSSPFFSKDLISSTPITPAPEVSRTMTYGTNAGGELSGTVTGETTITVKFEAGSDLIRLVNETQNARAQLTGALNANGPGSTGRSSPDAAAPSTGVGGKW